MKHLSAFVLLAGWLAPSVAALEVAIHVATEHHGSHSARHEAEIAELTRTALHGHHHDLDTTSHHDHHTLLDAQAPALRPSAGKAVLVDLAVAVAPSEGSAVEQPTRRGPSKPLFTAHHSLLL